MGGKGIDIRAKSIRVTFTYQGKQERRTIVLNGEPLHPSPANIKYAERLAAEIREKVRLGSFVMSEYFPVDGDTLESLSLEKHLEAWLSAQRIEHSTQAGYTSAAKFWTTSLPGKTVKGLKHSDILKAIAARPDLSGKTVNNYVSVLREAMDMAVLDGVIKESPVTEIPRAKHQKEPPDPFSQEESGKIITLAEQRHPGQVHNLIEFWFWTGLRTSEVFGLKWSSIDLNRREAVISEAMVRGQHKDNTKTSVARTVKLNSRAFAAIQRQRQHTQMAGGAVFTDPRYSSPWIEERAFRRSYWTPMLKTLGIRYRRPYNMRHSYATAMLMAGMKPAFCAGQLGHSVEVFLRTYAKWVKGSQDDEEMQRLEDQISPAYPQQKDKAP
jgi:integrase